MILENQAGSCSFTWIIYQLMIFKKFRKQRISTEIIHFFHSAVLFLF